MLKFFSLIVFNDGIRLSKNRERPTLDEFLFFKQNKYRLSTIPTHGIIVGHLKRVLR